MKRWTRGGGDREGGLASLASPARRGADLPPIKLGWIGLRVFKLPPTSPMAEMERYGTRKFWDGPTGERYPRPLSIYVTFCSIPPFTGAWEQSSCCALRGVSVT